MLAYLAGAIEYSPDLGHRWRRELSPLLVSLGFDVYDPAEDERKSLTGEEQKNLRFWKTTDFDRYRAAVRKIIEFDLEIVGRADCVVCLWDEYAALGGGTAAEVTWAFRRGIPVYMVTSLPVTRISGWILACCSEVFNDFSELGAFLKKQTLQGGNKRSTGGAAQR